MAWNWLPTYPTGDTRMFEVPDIMQDNFQAIEDILSVEHNTFISTAGSGEHTPGKVSVMFEGTTAEIAALTTAPDGSLAYDTTIGYLKKKVSGTWVVMTNLHSRMRAYLSASTSASTGASESYEGSTIIFDTVNFDSFSEYTPTDVFGGTNLIINDSMEVSDPPSGWAAINSPEIFERSSAQAHTGTYSARVFDSTASSGGMTQYLTGSAVVDNEYYQLDCWTFLICGSMCVKVMGGSDGAEVYSKTLTATGSWVQTVAKVLETSGSSASIRFVNKSGSAPAEFYVDDVVFKALTIPAGTFTAKASGDYRVIASVAVSAAGAIPSSSVVLTANADNSIQWADVPALGYSHDKIDEYPTATDTDYVISRTSGDRDLYTHHLIGATPIPLNASNIQVTVSFRARGSGCGCNSTCYGYTACSCNATCYNEACTCHDACYGFACYCNATCYVYTPCSCNYTTYGFSCTCNWACYYYYKTCDCDTSCYGYSCTCHNGCYGYVCSCDSTCYSYTPCTCNMTNYGITGCTCNLECYGYTACSCNSTCYDEGNVDVAPMLTLSGSSWQEYNGDYSGLTLSWSDYQYTFTKSPSTNLEWTRDEVNLIGTFGVKLKNDGGITTGCSGAVSQEYMTYQWYPQLPLYILWLMKNGVAEEKSYQGIVHAGTASSQTIYISTVLSLVPGDTLHIQLSVIDDIAENIIGSTDGAYTYLSIHRIEGQCV